MLGMLGVTFWFMGKISSVELAYHRVLPTKQSVSSYVTNVPTSLSSSIGMSHLFLAYFLFGGEGILPASQLTTSGEESPKLEDPHLYWRSGIPENLLAVLILGVYN